MGRRDSHLFQKGLSCRVDERELNPRHHQISPDKILDRAGSAANVSSGRRICRSMGQNAYKLP